MTSLSSRRSPMVPCNHVGEHQIKLGPVVMRQRSSPHHGNLIYGWFDDPDQTGPTNESPRDAPCLFCGTPARADDVRTHNLFRPGEYAARSYFHRTHKTCAECGPISIDGLVL